MRPIDVAADTGHPADMKQVKLNSVVWQEGRHYVAQCLEVDVSSFGPSRHAALENLREALALYYEDKHLRPIPILKRPKIARVAVRQR